MNEQEIIVDQQEYNQFVQHINAKFKSKSDLHEYFEQKLDWFLPKEDNCTLHFLQQVLRREKYLLSQNDICQSMQVKNWPELGVRHIWPMAIQFPDFMKYVPDEWVGGHRVDRDYFWKLLKFISPAFTNELINGATEQRQQRKVVKKVGPNFAEIDPAFMECLQAHPFYSKEKKKGPSIIVARPKREKKPRKQPQPIVLKFNMEDFIQGYPNNQGQIFQNQQQYQPVIQQANPMTGIRESRHEASHSNSVLDQQQLNQIQNAPQLPESSLQSVRSGSRGRGDNDGSFESAIDQNIGRSAANYDQSMMTLSNDKLGRNSIVDKSALSRGAGAQIMNKLGEKVKKMKEGQPSEFKI